MLKDNKGVRWRDYKLDLNVSKVDTFNWFLGVRTVRLWNSLSGGVGRERTAQCFLDDI